MCEVCVSVVSMWWCTVLLSVKDFFFFFVFCIHKHIDLMCWYSLTMPDCEEPTHMKLFNAISTKKRMMKINKEILKLIYDQLHTTNGYMDGFCVVSLWAVMPRVKDPNVILLSMNGIRKYLTVQECAEISSFQSR